jgi:hypothetical protein
MKFTLRYVMSFCAGAWAITLTEWGILASAQTLSPVAPAAAASSGFAVNWWLVAAIVAGLLIVLGAVLFVRYRTRNPEGAAQVQAAAVSDAQALGHAIAAAADSAVDRLLASRVTKIADTPSHLPGWPIEGPLPVVPQPGPLTEALPISGRLGQAGTLSVSVAVAGDAPTDIPAINAAVTKAYFG